MPEVKLYLFGSPHFEVGGQPIKLELRKSLALLTYLAIQRETIQRDFIINLLWPDQDPSRGRSLLRHILSPLRMALPDGWLVSDRETIRWQPDVALWVDVLEFRLLAASCGLHGHPESEVCPACQPLLTQAAGLYQDDFMAGYTLPDSPNFDEWQYFQAEGLRQALDNTLKKLVQCLILADRLDQAIQPARRRLLLDPLNEDAACDLMLLYAWTHQRNLALRQYHECKKVLRDQLGIEPHQTTLDLMQAIESGRTPHPPGHLAWQPALTPNPSRQSLAITPVDHLPELVDEMTPLELDILRLLAEKLFDHEIAEQLALDVDSVKRYTHQIYAKLAVENRRQAVEKAQALDLIGFNPNPIPQFHNLPRQLTSFIGRDKEIVEVVELVLKYPLVTLTGSGGTGKTRLALRAAEELMEDFADGIMLIELAPLADPGLVFQSVMTTLGLVEKPGKTPIQLLLDFLQPKRLLLILDNCEHLLNACAQLAAVLLHNAPRLTILATSREILGVDGEQPYRVPPLGLPDPRRLSPLNELAQFDAVRLFTERAGVVSPGFMLTEKNGGDVALITLRLDGIPMAIELAAARLRLLSIEQIALRLNDVFSLVSGGSRTALPRHQTLKAMIDWSYNLLSEQERLLLLRLSIFAGGWSLEAAEGVCSFNGLESGQILDLLGQLVDKSLAQTIQSSYGHSRYRMLETVRQYAYARLVESGGVNAVRDRHLSYFLALSLEAEPQLWGKNQVLWLDRLEQEMDNIRLALEWSLTGKVVEGMQLAAAFFSFMPRSSNTGSINWCDKLLEAEAALPDSGINKAEPGRDSTRNLARARVLRIASTGSIGFYQKYSKQDFDRLEESITICRRLGPAARRELSFTLFILGTLQADPDQATATLQEGLDLARKEKDAYLIAENLFAIALLMYKKGDLKQMRLTLEECLLIRRSIHHQHGIASCLYNLGRLACLEGDYQKASDYSTEGVDYFRAIGDAGFLAATLLNLSILERARGDSLTAAHRAEEALSLARNNDYQEFIISSLCSLGMVAWADGEYDLAEHRAEEALSLVQKQGFGTSAAQHLQGRVALSRGDLTAASLHLIHMLSEHSPVTWSGIGSINQSETIYILESIAVLAAAQGEMKRAAVLLGAIQEWEAQISGIYCRKERSEHQTALDLARQALGEQGFDVAWKQGQAMTPDQARAYALEEMRR